MMSISFINKTNGEEMPSISYANSSVVYSFFADAGVSASYDERNLTSEEAERFRNAAKSWKNQQRWLEIRFSKNRGFQSWKDYAIEANTIVEKREFSEMAQELVDEFFYMTRRNLIIEFFSKVSEGDRIWFGF